MNKVEPLEVIDERVIDLKKEKIEYWETNRKSCIIVVDAMREGIKLRHKFPPVYVVRSAEGVYQVNFGHINCIDGSLYPKNKKLKDFNYGGLHRITSHLLEDAQLRIRELNRHISNGFASLNFAELNSSTLEYIGFTKDPCKGSVGPALRHLPKPIAKRICDKYDLDLEEELSYIRS